MEGRQLHQAHWRPRCAPSLGRRDWSRPSRRAPPGFRAACIHLRCPHRGRGAGRLGAREDQRRLRGTRAPEPTGGREPPSSEPPDATAGAPGLCPGGAARQSRVFRGNFRTQAVAVTFLTGCTCLGPKATWRLYGTRGWARHHTPRCTSSMPHGTPASPRPGHRASRPGNRHCCEELSLKQRHLVGEQGDPDHAPRTFPGPKMVPATPLAERPRPRLPAPGSPSALVAPDPSPRGSLWASQHRGHAVRSTVSGASD